MEVERAEEDAALQLLSTRQLLLPVFLASDGVQLWSKVRVKRWKMMLLSFNRMILMASLMLLFLMAMLASPLSSSLGMSKLAYVVGPFVVELLNCVTVLSSKSLKL